jgi:bifunctional UDP-N-acetylglucosamine pyrophosphorylase/glucosamine-1-phosphate N-acetyltransferase
MIMNRNIIILAGGKGTRMNQDFPKVLTPVSGKPMIEYILGTVKKFVEKPVMVVGFEREKVMETVGGRAEFAIQEEQRGTGHAVLCAKPLLHDFTGSIVVLYGDHPLVSAQTIEKLFELREKIGSPIAMMTTKVEDFNGWRARFYSFGRIVRDAEADLKEIVELKNATDEQQRILEVNPGYYCFDSAWLWENIDKLTDKNKQQEFLLTDLISICVKEGNKISSEEIDPVECLGINTPDELAEVERIISNN